MKASALLDRIVYQIARAAIRAWFDEVRRERTIHLEVNNETRDSDLAAWYESINRVREEGPDDLEPHDAAPAGPISPCVYRRGEKGRWDRAGGSNGPGRALDRPPASGEE